MRVEYLGQPCRNFNVLATTTIMDPRDGLEKVVLSNFVAGGTGNLILIDPATGAGESIPLPADEGAWAILNLDDRQLLAGTCPRYGYLHRLDLQSRRWAQPLSVEGEHYIWSFCRGADGAIYAGTYPGCSLLRYDPRRHALENLGRVSDVKGNMYSRRVFAARGWVLIECGRAEAHLSAWDVETRTWRRFGPSGAHNVQIEEANDRSIRVIADGKRSLYDAATLKLLSSEVPPPFQDDRWQVYPGARLPTPLRDGRIFVVRGQDYYLVNGEPRPPLRPIPTERPPTRILTLTADAQGRLWGSSGFGQTIFATNGTTWNSPMVCNQGGEVYGMAFAGGRLFMSAYSGGDHLVYDPARPWDQIGNRNPKRLEPAGPELIRPHARSLIGPDGNFWTGWMARYGVYGGGLSRVDVDTLRVHVWRDIVPGQAVVALTADERYLYFTTAAVGNGLPPRDEPSHLVVCSTEGEVIGRRQLGSSARPEPLAAIGGRVLIAIESELLAFDPARAEIECLASHVPFTRCIVPLEGAPVAIILGADGLWRLDVRDGEMTRMGDLPGLATTATVTPNGTVYFAVETHLYRLCEVRDERLPGP